MDPKDRYIVMMGEYSFKARGLSVLIDQQQRVGEINNFVQTLAQIPGLLDGLNRDELLEALMLPLNWNVERLLISKSQPGVTGAAPQPAINPALQNPTQQRNAQLGAAQGGATNNPNAGGGGGQAGAMQGQLMQRMMQQMGQGGQRAA